MLDCVMRFRGGCAFWAAVDDNNSQQCASVGMLKEKRMRLAWIFVCIIPFTIFPLGPDCGQNYIPFLLVAFIYGLKYKNLNYTTQKLAIDATIRSLLHSNYPAPHLTYHSQ